MYSLASRLRDWLGAIWFKYLSRDPWTPVWFNKYPKPKLLKGKMIVGVDSAYGLDQSGYMRIWFDGEGIKRFERITAEEFYKKES